LFELFRAEWRDRQILVPGALYVTANMLTILAKSELLMKDSMSLLPQEHIDRTVK